MALWLSCTAWGGPWPFTDCDFFAGGFGRICGRGGAGTLGRAGGSLTFKRFGTGPTNFSPWDNIMCCFRVKRRLKLWPHVGQAKRPCSCGGFIGLAGRSRSFSPALCARTLGAPDGLALPEGAGYSSSLAPGATALRRYSASVRPFHASVALEDRKPQVCAASPTSATMPSLRRTASSPAAVVQTTGMSRACMPQGCSRLFTITQNYASSILHHFTVESGKEAVHARHCREIPSPSCHPNAPPTHRSNLFARSSRGSRPRDHATGNLRRSNAETFTHVTSCHHHLES